jgi:hypothetical protein
MTTFWLIAGGVGLIALAIIAAIYNAKRSGKLEAEREQAEAREKLHRKQAEVIAEHRTPDDASKRLSDGSF